MIASVPREFAVKILTRVLSDHIPLDIALDSSQELDPHARAWLRDVCSGTLRWKGRLDAAIDSTSLKKKPSGWLRKCLLVASYQLMIQERVAAAVVVNETVSLIKKREGEAPAKFANACLRKISETSAAWKAQPFPEKGSASEQALWASVPDWFWSKLSAQRGVDWCQKFAQACYSRPEIWIHAHTDEAGTLGEAGPVAGAYKLNQGGMISDQEGFSEGLFFVQDISSQILISEISKIVKSSRPGKLWALDLCAAPGGKSLGLAWEGFHVYSTDIDPERLKLVSQNAERMKSQIAASGGEITVTSRESVEALPLQDLVWVDAPCTGSGIIRRHPDVRWLRNDTDLVQLRKTQDELLKEAWAKTKPGGFVAYSVCSVFEDEGAGAVKRAGLTAYIHKDWLFTPHEAPHGDGFWGALLLKPTS